MGNVRGAVAAGTVAGITALILGTSLGTAGAAPLARRGSESPTGICASHGSHASTAAVISRRILRWVHRRAPETPRVAVRVDDPFLGINCYLNSREHFDSASVVKTIILATLLNKREREHLSLLSARERQLAREMITESDNDAATALWDEDGMKNLAYFLHAAGMNDTQLNPAWGLTQITAQDETVLLRNILLRPNTVLDTHAREYEDIAGPINRALAGAGARFGPAHTKPYPSWNIPDEPVPPAPAR
jgi:hypothetical protein